MTCGWCGNTASAGDCKDDMACAQRMAESVADPVKKLRAELAEAREAIALWKDEYESEVQAKAEWMKDANRMMKQRDEARALLREAAPWLLADAKLNKGYGTKVLELHGRIHAMLGEES